MDTGAIAKAGSDGRERGSKRETINGRRSANEKLFFFKTQKREREPKDIFPCDSKREEERERKTAAW